MQIVFQSSEFTFVIVAPFTQKLVASDSFNSGSSENNKNKQIHKPDRKRLKESINEKQTY